MMPFDQWNRSRLVSKGLVAAGYFRDHKYAIWGLCTWTESRVLKMRPFFMIGLPK